MRVNHFAKRSMTPTTSTIRILVDTLRTPGASTVMPTALSRSKSRVVAVLFLYIVNTIKRITSVSRFGRYNVISLLILRNTYVRSFSRTPSTKLKIDRYRPRPNVCRTARARVRSRIETFPEFYFVCCCITKYTDSWIGLGLRSKCRPFTHASTPTDL